MKIQSQQTQVQEPPEDSGLRTGSEVYDASLAVHRALHLAAHHAVQLLVMRRRRARLAAAGAGPQHQAAASLQLPKARRRLHYRSGRSQ